MKRRTKGKALYTFPFRFVLNILCSLTGVLNRMISNLILVGSAYGVEAYRPSLRGVKGGLIRSFPVLWLHLHVPDDKNPSFLVCKFFQVWFLPKLLLVQRVLVILASLHSIFGNLTGVP